MNLKSLIFKAKGFYGHRKIDAKTKTSVSDSENFYLYPLLILRDAGIF